MKVAFSFLLVCFAFFSGQSAAGSLPILPKDDLAQFFDSPKLEESSRDDLGYIASLRQIIYQKENERERSVKAAQNSLSQWVPAPETQGKRLWNASTFYLVFITERELSATLGADCSLCLDLRDSLKGPVLYFKSSFEESLDSFYMNQMLRHVSVVRLAAIAQGDTETLHIADGFISQAARMVNPGRVASVGKHTRDFEKKIDGYFVEYVESWNEATSSAEIAFSIGQGLLGFLRQAGFCDHALTEKVLGALETQLGFLKHTRRDALLADWKGFKTSVVDLVQRNRDVRRLVETIDRIFLDRRGETRSCASNTLGN
jgi:hypothetical protein